MSFNDIPAGKDIPNDIYVAIGNSSELEPNQVRN